MFDLILREYQATSYDFRKLTHPNDPLSYLFNAWINDYKLKWSVSHVLKPISVLEIGVDFGYSAAALLNGCPTAQYVGIDAGIDLDKNSDFEKRIEWARKITAPFTAKFITADLQTLNCLPGDLYDLVHISDRSKKDVSFHALELAINQAKFVLVDGYFSTHQNFTTVSDFLYRYADILDWYGVIPGGTGQLLIKTSESFIKSSEKLGETDSSLAIRQTYTIGYYMQDCGGFLAYQQHQGKRLEDLRLQAVAAIAGLHKTGQMLDLGCGRGELSYFFSSRGFFVTAIDYSQSAIDLAKKCFEGEEQLADRVEFFCDDVCNVTLSKQYDVAIASDLIEHLAFKEVDRLYDKVSTHLKPDGLFIVHTFPNLWYYKYDYSRRRRVAASVGAYLPAQPRSRYELLMHINEQSPQILKQQLRQHFEYVHLWFGSPEDPGGSLARKFTIRELGSAASLFAVASHQPIDQAQLKKRLSMEPMPPAALGKVGILVKGYPTTVKPDSEFKIRIGIRNNSEFILNSYGPNPVHIAYHWLNEHSNDYVVFEGARTRLFPPVPSEQPSLMSLLKPILNSTKESYSVRVLSPPLEGTYVLRVTLVQELVQWFDLSPSSVYSDILIDVTNSAYEE